jgi:hypothetical protein
MVVGEAQQLLTQVEQAGLVVEAAALLPELEE